MDRINTEGMIKIVDHMADIIIKNEVYFCELDSIAGDGDFGMSVAKGFKVLKAEWEDLSKNDIGAFLKDSGMIITEHCGGASGPIWGSAFRGAGKYAKGKEEVTLAEFAELMQSAVDAIQKRGKAQLGDKTLLDALIPTVMALKESAEAGEDMLEAMKKGAAAAREGAEKTKEMVASKGRATYVGERSLSHPDAGAMALGVIFTEIVEAL
ncbi:dihydroxyacetone kinase [Clostridium grantii DSM 8605]|uniref:phosphoenolpyruvate--glycerone phosphotransferase n=1 Tax=Clostridium grantii DSM 8605 TaxID=1121316 RepID=A0A1M5QR17_9CLOT|nr:dihydroxyacetone kinase [Clostridium grantii DSM 8605]